MQVNQRNFWWLGLAADNAFESCRSLAAGAAVLTAFSRYNTGSSSTGFENGYVARVLAARRDAGAAKVALPVDKAAAPIRDSADGWNVFPDGAPGAGEPPFPQRGDQIGQADTASILAIIAAAGVFGAPAAHAQIVGGGTDPNTILQAITAYILGPFGQSLAVLGLIAVGISFLLGRLGLFVPAAFIGGLILIFGSSYLVNQFLGGV